uniref:Protein KRI1 homolog n=1 Tax=Panagrolaimus davidi TaxID=227884 RepID=A0A914QH85_9BILA
MFLLNQKKKLLKALKKKELEEKLQKIKEVAGDDGVPLSTEDLKKDYEDSLGYEDIIADNLRTKFKYRIILAADDKQLNQWVSVKKASRYRNEKDEEYDQKASTKKKPNQKQQFQVESVPVETPSKRKNRRKNKSAKKISFQNGQVQKITDVDVNRLKAYNVLDKSLKRKIYGNENSTENKKPKTSEI